MKSFPIIKDLPGQLTAAACLGFGMAGLCAVADAGAPNESAPTQVVQYADLDITHEPGARVLYRRIQAAARQVCQPEVVSDLHFATKQKACFRHAVDEAVKHVDSAALAQIHGNAVTRLASR